MDSKKLTDFSVKFFLFSLLVVLFFLATSWIHTFTGNRVQQGLKYTPAPTPKDILTHDK